MPRKSCKTGYTFSEGKCRKNVTVNYWIDDDKKYHVDIDRTGRFGLQFSSYRDMRESIRPHVKFKKVSSIHSEEEVMAEEYTMKLYRLPSGRYQYLYPHEAKEKGAKLSKL